MPDESRYHDPEEILAGMGHHAPPAVPGTPAETRYGDAEEVLAELGHRPPSAVPDHPDIASVAASIADLAHGNCATKADVRLLGGEASTRNVYLKMAVAIGWGSSKKTHHGTPQVQGSWHADSYRSASNHLASACGKSAGDPSVSAGIADQIRKDPLGAFSGWKETYKVADLPHAAHYSVACDNCSGDGIVKCGAYGCLNGQTQCTHCNYTGLAVCLSCSGQGSVYHSGEGRSLSCRTCSGTGRDRNCSWCHRTLKVTCMSCNGRGTVRCGTCDGHGWFTHVFRAYLEAKVTRSTWHDKGAPDGFKRSCQAFPAASLAKGVGKLVRTEASSAPAAASATLRCEVRHVRAALDAKGAGVTVDAIGTGLAIPLMPPFLDEILSDLGGLTSLSDKVGKSNPSARLKEATQARVTSDILGMVGGGAAVDAKAFSRRWKGAVSEEFVARTEGRLRRAYAHSARSSVRGTWLLAAVPIAALMVLANAYHLPMSLFEATWPQPPGMRQGAALFGFAAAQAAVALPVLLVAWLCAGTRARTSLRAGVGAVAKRRPRQGAWPWLALLVAVAAGWGATIARVEGSALGLPFAPPAVASPPAPAVLPARTAPTPSRPTPGPSRRN